MESRRRPAARFALGGGALALIVALLVAGLAVGARPAFAQDGTPAPTQADATVRIVHASPDAPAVDVLLDGQPAAQNLAFGTASEYLPVPAGDHQVQVVPTGGSPADAVIDQTVAFEGGAAYEAAAVGLLNEIQLQAYEVNLDAIENAGQARLRVIHAVPDAPAVDVAVAGGDPIVEGVEFPNASDYADVDAGTYDLEVRNGDNDEVLLSAPGVAIEPGQVYDVFALGQGGTLQLLPLTTPVSPPCGQVLGIGQATDACFRVVHASPDAGPVDVYVGETAVVQALEFGMATDFAAAPSGDQQLRVVPAGQAPDQAAIDTTQELMAGQAYQVTATGLLAEIEGTVNQVDLTPLPEGQARVRVIHASPDTGDVDIAVGGGDTLFEGIEFRGSSDYAVVDAGTYDLQVREADGDTLLLEAPGTNLEAGMVYDVYAIGQTEDGTAQLAVFTATAAVRTGQMATPVATTPVTGEATPAAAGTPVVAVGASPVVETPGAATPAATPTS